jgi:L-threonylcarbamoyladenylate synthase
MQTLRLSASSKNDIQTAAALLRAGGLVAFPTETVYGLGANAFDSAAVARIFEAKGRPQDNPFIVHLPDFSKAARCALWSETAALLAKTYAPGPLTLVLPRTNQIPPVVSAGLHTVALRVPAHTAALALLRACGFPLAAPSANRSGSPSPTTAQHVLSDLDGRIDAVLDGGPCEVGVESTVVSLAVQPPCLLRPGGVSAEQLRALLPELTISPAVTGQLRPGEAAPSPGMKYRHYAPEARLTLVEGDFSATVAARLRERPARSFGILCFDETAPALQADFPGLCALCYGPANNAGEQARQLFLRLREIDERGLEEVCVQSPRKEGVGLAVYNRLLRACCGRTAGG